MNIKNLCRNLHSHQQFTLRFTKLNARGIKDTAIIEFDVKYFEYYHRTIVGRASQALIAKLLYCYDKLVVRLSVKSVVTVNSFEQLKLLLIANDCYDEFKHILPQE